MGKDSGSNPIQINCEIRVNSLNVPCLKFLVISVRVLCWGGCRSQRLAMGVSFCHSLPCFLRQGLSMNLKLTSSARLAGQ